MRTVLAVLLFAFLTLPVFAQDQAATARAAAGCGADNVEFDVKTDRNQHPEGQAEAGKALVYVFEDEKTDPGLVIGAVTTRIGLDGQWMGANHGKSYFFFSVDPGDHSVCASWQSSLKRLSKLAAAASLTAAPGSVYYFQANVDARSHDRPAVWMEAVDPAEAKILIASASLSTSHPKK
jgi:hypothetical protein